MTTFYRGPDVLITDQVFMVRRPQPIRFRIAFLRAAYIICWEPSFWSRSACGERELRAWYGSHEVSLFRSRDAIVFGQIQRGLLRALEYREQRREQAA
jgi:hypothetical protein